MLRFRCFLAGNCIAGTSTPPPTPPPQSHQLAPKKKNKEREENSSLGHPFVSWIAVWYVSFSISMPFACVWEDFTLGWESFRKKKKQPRPFKCDQKFNSHLYSTVWPCYVAELKQLKAYNNIFHRNGTNFDFRWAKNGQKKKLETTFLLSHFVVSRERERERGKPEAGWKYNHNKSEIK